MYRQCDFQKDNHVLRGWLPAHKAIKDTTVSFRGQTGTWKIIRTHGYSDLDEGFVDLGEHFVKRTLI